MHAIRKLTALTVTAAALIAPATASAANDWTATGSEPTVSADFIAPYLATAHKIAARMYPDVQSHCPNGLQIFSAADLGHADDATQSPAGGRGFECKIYLLDDELKYAQNHKGWENHSFAKLVAHEVMHAEFGQGHVPDATNLMFAGDLSKVIVPEIDADFPIPPSEQPASADIPRPSKTWAPLAVAFMKRQVGRGYRVKTAFVDESVKGQGVMTYMVSVKKRHSNRKRVMFRVHRDYDTLVLTAKRTNW